MDNYLKQKKWPCQIHFFNGDLLKTYFKQLLFYVLMKKSYGGKMCVNYVYETQYDFKDYQNEKKFHYPCFC